MEEMRLQNHVRILAFGLFGYIICLVSDEDKFFYINSWNSPSILECTLVFCFSKVFLDYVPRLTWKWNAWHNFDWTRDCPRWGLRGVLPIFIVLLFFVYYVVVRRLEFVVQMEYAVRDGGCFVGDLEWYCLTTNCYDDGALCWYKRYLQGSSNVTKKVWGVSAGCVWGSDIWVEAVEGRGAANICQSLFKSRTGGLSECGDLSLSIYFLWRYGFEGFLLYVKEVSCEL